MSQNDELGVLFPEYTLRVNDEDVTFHEITLNEQLRHRARIKPVVAAFAELATRLAVNDDEPSIDEIFDILAAHADDVAFLVPLSCGKDNAWYESLTGDAGENALLAWWTVNTGFFCRAVTRPIIEKTLLAVNRSRLAGLSPTSSDTVTDSAT